MEVRELWLAYMQKERDGFDTIFAKDIFADWETYRQPETKAEICLHLALELRMGQDQSGLSKQFLDRSLTVADRVLTERRFRAGNVLDEGPSQARGKTLEAQAFANALLGKGLDSAALRKAAPDFVTWALHERWDDHSEDAYLRAVRLLLIAGDTEQAEELLRIRKKFKWHGVQSQVLKAIAASSTFPIMDSSLLAQFDAIFDLLRPPYPGNLSGFTHSHMTRIELGAIRDKYFVSPDGEINWDRTVDAISR